MRLIVIWCAFGCAKETNFKLKVSERNHNLTEPHPERVDTTSNEYLLEQQSMKSLACQFQQYEVITEFEQENNELYKFIQK